MESYRYFLFCCVKNLTISCLSATLTLILSGDDDIFCSESIKAELLPSPDNIFICFFVLIAFGVGCIAFAFNESDTVTEFALRQQQNLSVPNRVPPASNFLPHIRTVSFIRPVLYQ